MASHITISTSWCGLISLLLGVANRASSQVDPEAIRALFIDEGDDLELRARDKEVAERERKLAQHRWAAKLGDDGEHRPVTSSIDQIAEE